MTGLGEQINKTGSLFLFGCIAQMSTRHAQHRQGGSSPDVHLRRLLPTLAPVRCGLDWLFSLECKKAKSFASCKAMFGMASLLRLHTNTIAPRVAPKRRQARRNLQWVFSCKGASGEQVIY